MKVLIWIGCIIAALLADLVLAIALSPFGLRPGALPLLALVAASSALARFLCIRYDRKRISNKATQTGETEVKVIEKKAPSSLLKLCEDFRGDKTALKIVIDNAVKERKISKAEAEVLMEEYGG